MDKRKFVLVLGADNATDLADPIPFEEALPQLALRNPELGPDPDRAGAPDLLTMPGVFAGGPTSGPQGDVVHGAYQTANLRDAAVRGVEMLAMFNPASVAIDSIAGTTDKSRHRRYPGVAVVTADISGSLFTVDVAFQMPQFAVVVSYPAASTVITVNTAPGFAVGNAVRFARAPATLQLTLSQTITYYVVTVISPTSFAVSTTPGGAPLANVLGIDNHAGLLMQRSDLGSIRRRHTNTLHTARLGALRNFDDRRTHEIEVTPAFQPPPAAGEEIEYPVRVGLASVDPAALVLSPAYGGRTLSYGVADGAAWFLIDWTSRVQVYLPGPVLPVGVPLNFEVASGSFPVGLNPAATYQTGERLVDLQQVATLISTSGFRTALPHQLGHGSRVRLIDTGLMPAVTSGPPLNTSTDYYVVRAPVTLDDPTTYSLARAHDGSQITFTFTVGATVHPVAQDITSGYYLELPDRSVARSSFVDVNAVIRYDSTQRVHRGSLSGMQVRAVTGTAANVGKVRPIAHTRQVASSTHVELMLGQAFPALAQIDDVFAIEPPPLDGSIVPFDRWAKWLPWSPFEGKHSNGLIGDYSLVTHQVGGWYLTIPAPLTRHIYPKRRLRLQPPTIPVVQSVLIPGGTASTVTGLITLAVPHGLTVGDAVAVSNSGGLPTGFLVQQPYVVFTAPSATTFTLGTGPLTGPVIPSTTGTANLWAIAETRPHATVAEVPDLVLFVHSVVGDAVRLTDSYGGAQLPIVVEAPRLVRVLHADHEGKRNPYPPGFSFPTSQVVPGPFQPFDLLSDSESRIGIGLAVPFGYRMFSGTGAPIGVLNLGVPGSMLAHDATYETALVPSFGWFDTQQVSWAPGDPRGCYGVLQAWLDAAVTAYQETGDTGECVGIVWLQGEADAANALAASRYGENLARFRDVLRADLVERGLAMRTVPFIAVKLADDGTEGVATVNAAIDAVARGDLWSRAVDVADLVNVTTGAGLIEGTAWFDALTHVALADLLFDAWLALQRTGTRTAVDICNLALANIGETARVVSIDPPDGSAQAAHCALFYPVARDVLLERHAWDFVTRFITLEPIEVPPMSSDAQNAAQAAAIAATGGIGGVGIGSSGRSDWDFAYRYPADVTGILGIAPEGTRWEQPPAPDNDWQTYTVELDANGDRVIYSSVENAVARVTIEIDDPARYSQLFVRALSYELAAMLAGPIVKGEEGAQLAMRMTQMARAVEASAQAQDSRKKRKPLPVDVCYPWARGAGRHPYGRR